MTHPVTVDQLRNLTDRAARGLSADEQQRLRDGIARLEHAEAALARIRLLAARIRRGVPWAANFDNLADRIEAALDEQSADDTTADCTCGHTGRGVSWHADHCAWRRSVVDCPGRPTPKPEEQP